MMKLFSKDREISPSVSTPLFTPITKREKKQGFLSEFTSPLLFLTPEHPLTLGQSFEGIQVFGGTGAGKTSGSGKYIATSMLHAGYGGLVLCAKKGEAADWVKLAASCSRTESVIRFGADTQRRFNFIQYEFANGASPFDIVDAIENAGKATQAAKTMSGGSDSQEFWNAAARDLLVPAMLILYAGTGGCVLETLAELIASAPRSMQQADDEGWQKSSRFFALLMAAMSHNGKYVSMKELNTAMMYFRTQYAPMSEKMRTSVVQTLMTTLNRFSYGSMSELFTTDTDVVPEMTHEGAIIIVDLPAMVSTDNRVAAQIWKYAWQRATQNRTVTGKTRPVFLWADESQYFLSEKDVEFQSTARSSRVTTVYMTQSMKAYKHAVGGTEQANTATRAFIANLRTQIFHSNNDDETNNYAAELIGKAVVWRRNVGRSSGGSTGTSRSWSDAVSEAITEGTSWNEGTSENESRSDGRGRGSNSYGFLASSYNKSRNKSRQQGTAKNSSRGGSGSRSETMNRSLGGGDTQSETFNDSEGAQEQKDYLVPPEDFAHSLRTGGEGNDCKIDAIVVSPVFPEPFRRITYDQRAV